MITVERIAELMVALLAPPYDSPRVRMERRDCRRCGRETDHEVGEWPEHLFERGLLFPRFRRVRRCLHCGLTARPSHPLRGDLRRTETIPLRAQQPYAAPSA